MYKLAVCLVAVTSTAVINQLNVQKPQAVTTATTTTTAAAAATTTTTAAAAATTTTTTASTYIHM